MGQPLLIDLVADVVCPWCYLGWRRVKSALALRPDVEPLIVWRPYQLDPSLPEQGVDRKAYMAGKFKDMGSSFRSAFFLSSRNCSTCRSCIWWSR